MTLFICSSCRNLQGTVFCIDRQSDNLNNRLKLSDYTLDRAGNSMITDRDTIYRLALLLGNDTTGYGNWKQYYRIPFDGNRTMRLVLDGGDDPGPREYLILHDEHGKIVRYIEIAAEYGDGPPSSLLTWRRAGTKRRLWRRWTRLRGLWRLFLLLLNPDQNNIVSDLTDIPKGDHKFFFPSQETADTARSRHDDRQNPACTRIDIQITHKA